MQSCLYALVVGRSTPTIRTAMMITAAIPMTIMIAMVKHVKPNKYMMRMTMTIVQTAIITMTMTILLMMTIMYT